MLCEECHEKPVSVYFTQMINGKKIELKLCEDCAAKKGAFIFDIDGKFSIPNLLGSFLGNNYNVQDMSALSASHKCKNCNTNLADIRRTGKLGCAECYVSFDRDLEPILRRVHGNSRHIGKIPVRGGNTVLLKKRVENLKLQLQQAVAEENYEKAAEIRDAIKEAEKKIK